ncbi:hypothetical protein DEJ09_02640 [Curtobacterium sp. MCLR17_055]|nr:hypothetical protein DEJ09_02640 [Curtobacterium sp. MCLR17_055]
MSWSRQRASVKFRVTSRSGSRIDSSASMPASSCRIRITSESSSPPTTSTKFEMYRYTSSRIAPPSHP